VLSALRPLLNYPELIPVVTHDDQPVMRWMFGTDRPGLRQLRLRAVPRLLRARPPRPSRAPTQ